MLEEGGGSCGANNHTCWQNSAKAWEHASKTINTNAFSGFQQIYFAAQASLAYNIADGASQEVIEASIIHVEDAYRGLLTNGYAGQKIGESTAFDSSGFEALGLA